MLHCGIALISNDNFIEKSTNIYVSRLALMGETCGDLDPNSASLLLRKLPPGAA